jgi:hypothetical protein
MGRAARCRNCYQVVQARISAPACRLPEADYLPSAKPSRSCGGWGAPIMAVQTGGSVSPEQSFMAAAANGWVGWGAVRPVLKAEPRLADVGPPMPGGHRASATPRHQRSLCVRYRNGLWSTDLHARAGSWSRSPQKRRPRAVSLGRTLSRSRAGATSASPARPGGRAGPGWRASRHSTTLVVALDGGLALRSFYRRRRFRPPCAPDVPSVFSSQLAALSRCRR